MDNDPPLHEYDRLAYPLFDFRPGKEAIYFYASDIPDELKMEIFRGKFGPISMGCNQAVEEPETRIGVFSRFLIPIMKKLGLQGKLK